MIKKRRFRNAVESDFVIHSSSFGDLGVDFGCRFEAAFSSKNQKKRTLEAGFQRGFAKNVYEKQNLEIHEICLKPCIWQGF